MQCDGAKAPMYFIINICVFVIVAFLIESRVFLFFRLTFVDGFAAAAYRRLIVSKIRE